MIRRLAPLMLLAAACATPKGARPAVALSANGLRAADYYPLELGTSWSYEVNLLGEKRDIEVKLTRLVDGFVEDSTGVQLKADELGVRDQRRYLLQNPIEAGTKWNNVVSVSAVEHYEIVGVDQPCEAPAGHWAHCVVVESRSRVDDGRALLNEMTFAPGVGIVRLSTTLEQGGQRVPQALLLLNTFRPVTPPPPPAGVKSTP